MKTLFLTHSEFDLFKTLVKHRGAWDVGKTNPQGINIIIPNDVLFQTYITDVLGYELTN